MAVLVELHTP
jgi:hypothetical protein